MPRKSIFKQNLYLNILKFLINHKLGYVASSDITLWAVRNGYLKQTGEISDRNDIINFSMKLKQLDKHNFTKIIKIVNKGRAGRISYRKIQWNNITKHFLKNYFPKEFLYLIVHYDGDPDYLIEPYCKIVLKEIKNIDCLDTMFLRIKDYMALKYEIGLKHPEQFTPPKKLRKLYPKQYNF
jgi:hypothetical protein